MFARSAMSSHHSANAEARAAWLTPALTLSRVSRRASKTPRRCSLYALMRDLGALSPDDLQWFVFKLVSRTSRWPCSECERGAARRSFAQRSLALLLDLKMPCAAGQHHARESRRIVDHHDVDRIAVIGFGRWHEAPSWDRLVVRSDFERKNVSSFGRMQIWLCSRGAFPRRHARRHLL